MIAGPAVAGYGGMMFFRLVGFWMFASGFVLPMGLPPGPEDPVVANVAPQECLFYMGWASMATPDPKSPNQLEQLFAEPEFKQLLSEVDRLIREMFVHRRSYEADLRDEAIRDVLRRKGEAAPAKKPPGAAKEEAEIAAMMDDVVWLVKKAISSPGAVYLANLEIRDPRQPPAIQGGAIVGLGDDAAKVRALLEKHKRLVPQPFEAVKIGDESLYRFVRTPDFPVLTCGIYGKYFVVGIGDGEAEALVKRMEGKPPEWLAAVRQRLVVERPATISYLNVKKIVGLIREKAGPEAGPVIGALGLDNFISYASVAGLDKEGYASKSLLTTQKRGGDLLAFLGTQPMQSTDLAPIPRDATLAAAARIEPDQLWQTIVSVMAKADPRAGERFAEELSRAEQQLGLKLREDLLQPLGGVWCIYNSPGEGGLVVTGLTAVGQLKDAKRAKASHDKILAVLRQEFDRMQRDFQFRDFKPPIRQLKCAGQDVYMLELPFRPMGAMGRGPGADFPFAPSWCVTDKEMIVAAFPQNVKAYLLRGPEYQSLATVPEVAEMLKAEPGPVAVTYMNTPDLFRLVYPVIQIMARFMTAEMQREGVDVPLAVLPSAPAIGKHLRPGVTAVRRTQDGLETTARHSLPGQDIGASAPVMVALLLPAVQSAREAARRATCANNLRQIDLALLNYEQTHRAFPPAYTVDKNGKPLLSWRVLILPYLERQELYQQFHLDEPWDSDHNKKLIASMPPVFRCPSGKPLPGKTTYLTVRGKDTIFPGDKGISLADVTDGTSNTILVVDAADQSAVEWSKPDDFTADPNNPTKGLLGHHPVGFTVAMADGSVHFLIAGIDPNMLRALFTRNGGEVIRQEELYAPPRRFTPPPRIEIKKAVKEGIAVPPTKEAQKPEPPPAGPPKATVRPPETKPARTEAPQGVRRDSAGWWGGAVARRAAQVYAARVQIQALSDALDAYDVDMRGFPSTSQGLEALRAAPKDLANKAGWHGPYLTGPVPTDPWGRPYQYAYPGKHGGNPDVWSLGPDGRNGTEDDITSWSDR
jgi:type II secretion system protein G